MAHKGKITLPILVPEPARAPAAREPEGLWRSLEELGRTERFQEMVHREFPVAASEWDDTSSRRHFLKLMGASLALAGAYGCTKYPEEKIVPYVRPPEEVVPGKPLLYATAVPFDGYALGALVESHMGRPTKVEGNPDHPASLGATNVFMQASVLDLYDPQRLAGVNHLGMASNWDAFAAALGNATGGGYSTLAILTPTVTSPTLGGQLAELVKRGAKWYQFQAVGRDHARAGAVLAFGQDVNCVYDFAKAQVVVSLDDDFLFGQPGSLRYARQFSDGRRVRRGRDAMNRLYVAEASRSITGAMADHRVAMKPSEVTRLATALAAALGVNTGAGTAALAGDAARFVEVAARDLKASAGKCLVAAGETQPAIVHALAHAMNQALGNAGQTVSYIGAVEAGSTDQAGSIKALARDLDGGAVTGLLILGGNPIYTAPADLKFGEVLKRFSSARAAGGYRNFSAYLTLDDDETAEMCQWALPASHYLEAWGDVRAFDGTASIIQPLIAPLYPTKSAVELLAMALGQRDKSGYELVRNYWLGQAGGGNFEAFWETSLSAGIVANSASAPVNVSVRGNLGGGEGAAAASGGAMEVVIRPDPSVWDGSRANNAWLQELPKPITKLTWDNAAYLSVNTAVALGLSGRGNAQEADGKVIRLKAPDGATIEAAALVVPGHADGCITLTLGYGRRRGGMNAVRPEARYSYDANRLRTAAGRWVVAGVTVEATGETYRLAVTQHHQLMEGRGLVKVGTIEQFRHNPLTIVSKLAPAGNLYGDWEHYDQQKNAWAMVIDNNACIGCNACVTACQAENNIPVVGKEQVLKNREMHWLRIDTYFSGDLASPEVFFEPVPCMHCEKAPCELVCPVGATTHSTEGINEMTYNRCVGTRYCSNNCPYKVRRFNFLQFSDLDTQSLKMVRNPDVTVRNRGVMEKCTYCIQRINKARIESKKDNDRPIRDGEILTACQQACPTQAIVFGNQNDPSHQVTKLKHEPLKYDLLAELNTRPRTSYLARLTNRNAELPAPAAGKKEDHGA